MTPFREKKADGWHFSYNWPQSELMESKARFPVLQCGARVGKTTGLVRWLARQRDKCGPGHYMFVSATYPLMDKSAMQELMVQFQEIDGYEYQAARRRFVSKTLNEEGQPEYVVFLGSAEKPESLAATTLKAAAFDEAGQNGCKQEAFVQLFRGLAINQGRMAIGTTLYAFANGYRYEVYDRAMSGDPNFEIIQADSIENPAFPVEEYYRLRDTMPTWKFNMTYRGIYERPIGSVYDCFDPDAHIIDPFVIPSDWVWVWGHDFGPSNTAAVAAAIDPSTGNIYLHFDYHRGGLSIRQHVEEFKKYSRGSTPKFKDENGPRIAWARGGAHQEDEIRQAYAGADWLMFPPDIHNVDAGIQHAYSFIARNQVFVFKNCHPLIDEFLTYSYDVQDYQPNYATILNKNRFHLMDSFRYLMTGIRPERAIGQSQIAKMQTHYGTRRNATYA